MFSPFGPNNMKPIFLTKNVEVSGIPSIVGENHLKFKVKCNGMVIDAIGFGMSNFIERLKTNKGNLSLVYSIEENNYMGRETIQLRIRDLR
jgi:single-stranded-DNA-specific exonuclease